MLGVTVLLLYILYYTRNKFICFGYDLIFL